MSARPGAEDITKMKRRSGESEWAFWRRKVEADGGVVMNGETIEVLRRNGESDEDYQARLVALAPPFSDRQKAVIRSAADEYWTERRQAERRRIMGEPESPTP